MKILNCFYIFILFSVAVTKSITEDDGSECDSDSECLPSTNCQYYQEQQALLKTLTDKTLRAKLIQKLRKLICNKKERGICCPKSEDVRDEKCGYPQIDSSNVSFLPYQDSNLKL